MLVAAAIISAVLVSVIAFLLAAFVPKEDDTRPWMGVAAGVSGVAVLAAAVLAGWVLSISSPRALSAMPVRQPLPAELVDRVSASNADFMNAI